MSESNFVSRAHDRLREGDPDGAVQVLRDGLVQTPSSVEGWCSLADTLTRRHDYDEALQATTRALQAQPGDPRALISRARTLRALGQGEAALDAFTRALRRQLREPLRAHGLMELGRTLDELGRYDEAWEAITLGQQIRRGQAISARVSTHWLSDHLGAMQRWLDIREPTPAIPWDDDRPRPIFLVGVPRSGTTLMEQILVAAGAQSTAERPALSRAIADVVEAGKVVYPGGIHEWPAEVVQAVRQRFFERVGLDDDVQILHKLPLDLLHTGLVHRVFDGAPVIQALRDPRDTVLSGYFQNLVINPAMLNWTEPRQLALATRGLLQLGQRWASDLEGLNLRVQRYDRLTEEPDDEMRDLVSHAGLRFTEAVARFHEGARARYIATPSAHAVTEPVHARARARWQRYARQLAPIFELLEPVRTELGFGGE